MHVLGRLLRVDQPARTSPSISAAASDLLRELSALCQSTSGISSSLFQTVVVLRLSISWRASVLARVLAVSALRSSIS
jgi:hypothetical protein